MKQQKKQHCKMTKDSCTKIPTAFLSEHIFTGRNEVVAKVCVCPQGGCLPQCMLGCHTPLDGEPLRMENPPDGEPPLDRNPPGWRTPPDGEPPWMENPPGWRTPLDGEPPPRWRTPPDGEPPRMENPPGWRTPPDGEPPPGSRLQHTVYERPVRILLECILVHFTFDLCLSRVKIPWY